MLYHSLKLLSKDIAIYTFNIAQFNLLNKKLINELSTLKLILFDENYPNFVYSDYIIISYIESEISENSRKNYPYFNSNMNKKFCT